MLCARCHSARSHALRRASATQCPLHFVPRCQHSVSCTHCNTLFTTPVIVISLTHNSILASRSTCSRTRLTVLSRLSTDSAYIRLCYLVHKRSRQCRSLGITPCTAAGRRSARETVIHLHSSSAVANVKVSSWSPPTSMRSHQSTTTGSRRDGQGNDVSSHHAINTLANGSHECYFSV